MSDFLKLLIFKTQSIDGFRGTSIAFKESVCKKAVKNYKAANGKITDY